VGAQDIFAGQAADPSILAALYDLEHDAVTEDLPFYRDLAQRADGDILELGCGSGRLVASLLPSGPARFVGVDGSATLLTRARDRVAGQSGLATAARDGRLTLRLGDVRRLGSLRLGRFGLVVAAGVLPHLDGPAGVVRMLRSARSRLARGGRLVLDDLGPALLPTRSLGWSIDWRRRWGDRRVVRRSQLVRHEESGGTWVAFSTVAEVTEADGTIARLPASHRLWYPSASTLVELLTRAGLTIERTHGSHDLEPLGATSERSIYVVGRQE
jgi:SAM-dependent methyltransferase